MALYGGLGVNGLIQVELALKQATSKSRTPVSMYQFDPIWIVYEK